VIEEFRSEEPLCIETVPVAKDRLEIFLFEGAALALIAERTFV